MSDRLKTNVILAVLLLIEMLISLTDLLGDFNENVSLAHVITDVLIVVISMCGLLFLGWRLRRREQQLHVTAHELEQVRSTLGQHEQQAAKLLGELSLIIQQQFAHWGLSDAEREVAMLLLKGLSLEEIAAVRGRAEKTVRQQASSIYTKAGLEGRHALSAYFFEDLLRT